MKKLIVLLSLCAVLVSCQKKDTTSADPTKVTWIVTSPATQQIFRSGDTIRMIAHVSYPSELHGYEIKITDSSSGNIVYDNAQHLHDDHFDISQVWVNTSTAAATLKLLFTAEIDHDGTEADTAIYVKYQP